jgi:hypothetical protein
MRRHVLTLAKHAARKLIAPIRPCIDLAKVLFGAATYKLNGTTPAEASQALIRLFCLSGGRFNDLMNRAVRVVDDGTIFPEPTGMLGVRTRTDAERIAEDIRLHGYHVFAQRLPDEMCERLLAFAVSTKARIRPMDDIRSLTKREGLYQRGRPEAARYDFKTEDVINLPDVQRLMADPSLLWVAQSYLGTTPLIDVTSMWWHTAFSDQPDAEAGQFYHFDMDRIKWLKLFIYLTDVEAANGPHCFIEGSHRTGGIPSALLARGYARIRDSDVFDHYVKATEVQFVAPRGTVIAEDTRGLHKGLEVRRGDRLMLQLQFSDSLFGAPYAPSCFRTLIPEMAGMVKAYPAVYKSYAQNAGV